MRRTIHFPPCSAILAAALLLVAALPASAGGPLANCQSGQPFLWPNGGGGIPFNPDQGDLGSLTNAEAVAEVQAAFDVWGSVPSSSASYANTGQLPVDVDAANYGPFLSAAAPDGLSAIVFDDTGEIFDDLFGPGSGILGFAGPEWGNAATCEILEGLAFLNGPALNDATAARDVMVHEFGHYTNLAHTVVNGQVLAFGDTSGPAPFDTFGPTPGIGEDAVETMYPFYFGPGSGTQTLGADDVAILSTLYPAPDFFGATGAIKGTIYAPNGSTRLTGANVIARNVADPFYDAVSAISSHLAGDYSQGDLYTGRYTMNGLTPGAEYAVYVDEILAGGFSTPPLSPLLGPEEFYNGPDESHDPATDDPSLFTPVTAIAGSPVSGIDIILNGPAPGILELGDDDFQELSLPFAFTICGQTYRSVFVNSNGNLTFGSGDTGFSESATELLSSLPRIAPLWDDLNPAQGGTVSWGEARNSFTVRFEGVPEFFGIGANSFEVTLRRASNHIDLAYGEISAADGLAGVSCGGAVTSGFETASDLSFLMSSVEPDGRINLHNQAALYEQFNPANPHDLEDSTLLFNGTTDYDDNWAEPNDSLRRARRIQLPFDTISLTRYSEIEPTGEDVNYYRFQAQAGQALFAEIIGGQLDTLLGLFDKDGNLLSLDDDGGIGLLSKLVFPIPADGEYILAISGYPDLDFSGDGNSGGRYVLYAIEGDVLDLGDDESEEVPLDFTFPYQGQGWTSVWVNSNGNLTFGSGDTDFSESASEFLAGQPRIAPLWDDLNPSRGGLVLAEGDDRSMTISFMAVPEYFSTGSNSFAVTMGVDGSVEIAYGLMTVSDGLVGVTEGGGAIDPDPTDLSAAGSLSVVGTAYEQFTGSNRFDLDETSLSFVR